VVQFESRTFIVIVGHAPLESDWQAASSFWEQVCFEIGREKKQYPCSTTVLLVDANGRVGSHCDAAVRKQELASCDSPNGERLRSLLTQLGLTAVNTHFCIGHTWRGPKGNKSRIDYVGLPCEVFDGNVSCEVSRQIQLSEGESEDHSLVVVTFEIPRLECARKIERHGEKKMKISFEKLADPWCVRRYEDYLSNFWVDSKWDIDEHQVALRKHICSAASVLCYEPGERLESRGSRSLVSLL